MEFFFFVNYLVLFQLLFLDLVYYFIIIYIMYWYNKIIIGVLMLFGSLMKIKFLKIFYFDGNFVYFDCCDNKNKRSL